MMTGIVLKSELLCVALFPNCRECGVPLLGLDERGVSIIDRREIGMCAECEEEKDLERAEYVF